METKPFTEMTLEEKIQFLAEHPEVTRKFFVSYVDGAGVFFSDTFGLVQTLMEKPDMSHGELAIALEGQASQHLGRHATIINFWEI